MKEYFSAYICPKCQESLMLEGNSLECVNKHSFDIAKEGYVNLILANQKSSLNSGDTKEMILARDKFLGKGYYDFLLQGILELIKKGKFAHVLEVGCGSGFYLSGLEESARPNLALGADVSKEAVKFAAKRYKNCYFSVNNSFNLCFKPAFFDLVISVFSPFDNLEIEKVLKRSGMFILVRPGKNHFAELYDLVGMPKKEKSLPEFANMKILKSLEVSQKAKIGTGDLKLLIEMSPLFWKIKNFEELELSEITFDFSLSVYQY